MAIINTIWLNKNGFLVDVVEIILMKQERDKLELSLGAYVTLSIGDSGSGMEEDTLSHLFEPFFTTKEVGKGTGLGLATVHGIGSQRGGDIAVERELCRGARGKPSGGGAG